MSKINLKQRFIIIGLTIFGCLLILFFGLRSFHAFQKFDRHDPREDFPDKLETDVEQVQEWMTIPFISHMYGVPEPILYEALDVPFDKKNNKKSLEDLNDEYFPETDSFVIETVKATLLANQSPPTPVPPLTAIPPATSVP